MTFEVENILPPARDQEREALSPEEFMATSISPKAPNGPLYELLLLVLYLADLVLTTGTEEKFLRVCADAPGGNAN